jgi:biopolymer transport protein TolR
MAMNQAGNRQMQCEMNVTPLIDVLLVLLVIFMVIVPSLSRGEVALAPQPPRNDGRTDAAVILEVLRNGEGTSFRINQQVVSRQDLRDRLAEIYAKRAERVLFVKGDDQLKFTQVAEVIDIGHAAGVDRVGLITPKVAAGL